MSCAPDGLWLHRWGVSASFVFVLSAILLRAATDTGVDWPAELAGKPVVGRNADGQLEVFAVGHDGLLRHRRQNPANGDWSAWLSLGGSVLPGIAVANNM